MKTIATLVAAVIASVALASPGHAVAPSHDRENVVVFGDSIANGGGTYDPDKYAWPTRMGAARTGVPGGCLVTSAQLCGSHMRPGIGYYGRTVLTEKPDVVIVAYGMNDLVHSTARQITNGIRAIKDRNDARGITTYVATLTPLGEKFMPLDPFRAALNNTIRSGFAKWRVIDLDAALVSPTGTLPARFDSGDNLHPNAAAYKVMAKAAQQALERTSWRR